MLKGKDFGKAIGEAIDLKLKNGSVATKAEIARHFGMKPPSLSDWVKKGSVAKHKLPELWRYFSDVVGPAHWDLTPQEWPAGLSDLTFHGKAQRVAEETPVYRVSSQPISEAMQLMEQMPVEWQRQALGAIKIIHSQFCDQHQQNSTERTAT